MQHNIFLIFKIIAKQPLHCSGFPFYSWNFALVLSWVCLPVSLSNLQLYSRPNIGVGMLGWAVCVSHNKALHKGVALSLTSSHLTAWHGQVVCMETRMCVCAWVYAQWGPSSPHPPPLWWGREIIPSLPSCFFIWSVSQRFVSSHSFPSTTLTFVVSVFIFPSLPSRSSSWSPS